MKIAIVGAFDRINYGDMLFPWILDYELEQHSIKCDINYFGWTQSDYSSIGAKKTSSIKDLNKNAQQYDYIIIAGGDAMNAYIYSLDLDSASSRILIYIKLIIKKLIGEKYYNYYLRKKYKTRSNFPYNIPLPNVIYNGCGGSSLDSIDCKQKEMVLSHISTARYVSVRDGKTKDFLETGSIYVKLIPDSATMISTMWSKEYLSASVSNEIYKMLCGRKYIVFQINNKYSKCNYPKVKDLFDVIQAQGYEIVLLPIGRCTTHGDITALSMIKKEYENCILIGKDCTLIDTAYIIANC